MAHNYTCPRCKMNHRQEKPGRCWKCAVWKDEPQSDEVCQRILDQDCAAIRAKDAAGKPLSRLEYAIARVLMQPYGFTTRII